MASFKARIGWKMARKKKANIVVMFRSKKIQKITLWLHFKLPQVEGG